MTIAVGDRVRVKTGHLAGQTGYVVELDGGHDLDAVLAIPVALNLDGGLVNVSFQRANLELVR